VSKRATTEIIRANLPEHPAVKAWRELEPQRIVHDSIEILQEAKKSAIYRLAGVGLGGSAVIAKLCRMATALIERAIYEEILPHLPITALHYYGFIEEDDEFCWLFLEDVGQERFSPLVEEHRILATQWLGLMHIFAARVAAAARLPDGGPGCYLEHLQSARRTILRNLTNPALSASDVALLETVVSQCDILELHWSEVEKSCEGMPATLVHGDFQPKNIYVRTDQAGTRLFPVDWETAGWGVPAADLAPACGLLPVHQVDMTAYWFIVREYWPSLDMQAVQRLANVGRIFRQLAAISWESRSLAYEWLEKPIASMRVYQAEMANAIQVAYGEDL